MAVVSDRAVIAVAAQIDNPRKNAAIKQDYLNSMDSSNGPTW
jgi:hypothetical protein